jgi:hypothetical protein
VTLLPSSARLRRRLAWTATLVVVAGAVAAAVVLVPGGRPLPPETFSAAPATHAERQVRLTVAMRTSIDRTIARFVPAAVERRDPALAWQLSGPGLRSGTTRADWLAGDLPVFPFRVRNKQFRGWKPVLTYRDHVAFDLLLQPPVSSRKGDLAVSVDVVRRGGRWLVDGWYPSAVFTGPEERPWVTGSPDFTPDGSTSDAYDGAGAPNGRLDPAWLLVPVLLLGAIALIPVGFAIGGLRRRARARMPRGA